MRRPRASRAACMPAERPGDRPGRHPLCLEALVGAAADPRRRRPRPDGQERRRRSARTTRSRRASSPSLVAGLTEQPPKPVANPSAPVTLAQLDAKLVRTLELGDEAALFQQAAVAAGLRPPARFGTEVVARLLGLRTNHLGRPGRPRAPAERPCSARRGRLLRRADPAPVRVGDEERGGGRLELRATRPHALAAPRAHDRGRLHRLPVRLGRRVRAPRVTVRRAGARRIRLLRLRLARLQAPVVPGSAAASRPRSPAAPPPAMAAEVPRRGESRPARLAPADLVFFGAGGPRASRSRSTTWASTSGTAG